jgi:ATP-dependent Clp protease ATP-binding subunit ClpB
MVGSELQDQLASRIGVQAEAHDVAETAPRRLAARRLELDVTAAAREWLAALSGFDPLYGARPLRRLVQSAIEDQLARRLLAGEIRDGDTVRVDLDAAADRLTVTDG